MCAKWCSNDMTVIGFTNALNVLIKTLYLLWQMQIKADLHL